MSAATAEGRLPNFGRILDTGAAMHLATLRPTQPEPVWTAVATGKLPAKNGVRSAARYPVRAARRADRAAAGLLLRARARPVRARAPRCRTPRRRAGAPALEHPGRRRHPGRHRGLAADVSGAARPRLPGERSSSTGWAIAPLDPDDHAVGYPADTLLLGRGSRPRRGRGRRRCPAATWRGRCRRRWRRGVQRPALRHGSRSTSGSGGRSTPSPVQFTAVRFRGLDTVGHYYLRYAQPRHFGDVTEDEARRYGRVLERPTPSSTRRSAARWRRSRPTICCWSSRASGWSRSARQAPARAGDRRTPS